MTVQEVLAVGRVLGVADATDVVSATTSAAERPAPPKLKWNGQLHGHQPEELPAHGRLASPSPTQPLPAHLGWHSEALTRSLRASAARQAQRQAQEEARNLDWLHELTPVGQSSGLSGAMPTPVEQSSGLSGAMPTPVEQSSGLSGAIQRITLQGAAVKLYPSLALGILRQNLAATGRLWLLLRHLDSANSGWIAEAEAVRQLTGKGEPLHVCGRRQWHNLLKQGEGIFWQRGNGRLWLRSVAKVAAALGVERLVGKPIALPLEVLTQGIGAVRAHLYASFHSGRANDQRENGRPISRQTLKSLSKVSHRSQQAYEARTRVCVRRNDAVGPAANLLTKEEQSWQHGTALYQLTDYRGHYGRPNATYFAWQLPNSYSGPHQPLPRGRQKRINRELVALFTNGMTGNDALPQTCFAQRRYCSNGKAAGTAARQAQTDEVLYWPAVQSKHGHMWYAWEVPSDDYRFRKR